MLTSCFMTKTKLTNFIGLHTVLLHSALLLLEVRERIKTRRIDPFRHTRLVQKPIEVCHNYSGSPGGWGFREMARLVQDTQ